MDVNKILDLASSYAVAAFKQGYAAATRNVDTHEISDLAAMPEGQLRMQIAQELYNAVTENEKLL